MTIVVASAAPDGIVLASDSRTTQRRGDHHRVASNAAQKVYDAWGRIGLAAYGIATIGSDSIRSVINGWLAEADQTAALGDAAKSLAGYLQARLSDATPAPRGKILLDPVWPLGVLVAGYDEVGVGRVLEVRVWPLQSKVVDTDAATDKPSSMWRGQTGAVRRLVLGFDEDEMKKVGVAITEQMEEPLSTIAYDLIQPTTLQDAVDLAYFAIDTTVQMQRFSDGTFASQKAIPGCGGPTQCLAVTPAGVRWVHELTLLPPARVPEL
ncbi:MAG TPA: hypothetical protein VK701_04525 [Solirubrobacteraceae bacterium]|nr:hypothetical protein [Solirubrobacteraceae bacterium]